MTVVAVSIEYTFFISRGNIYLVGPDYVISSSMIVNLHPQKHCFGDDLHCRKHHNSCSTHTLPVVGSVGMKLLTHCSYVFPSTWTQRCLLIESLFPFCSIPGTPNAVFRQSKTTNVLLFNPKTVWYKQLFRQQNWIIKFLV